MKIGIMGGTFDPIHNGHIMLGEYAYRQFLLDQVWFMPNGQPPHKRQASIELDAENRTRMVALAIQGNPRFRLERYEVDKRGTSYSYQTLEYFHKRYPEDEFYFIIGADSLFAIEQWMRPERIFPVCTILAAYRDDKANRAVMSEEIKRLKKKYHARIELLETPLLYISSHELRQCMKDGGSIRQMVPAQVDQFIKDNKLYKDL